MAGVLCRRSLLPYPFSATFRLRRQFFSTEDSSAFQLRPYQETCLQTCLDVLEKAEFSRIGISLPTGSGKTTIFTSLISRLQTPSEAPEASRALIIVNTIELARQSAEQIKRLFPELTVEIEQGSGYKATGSADVTVATYQTLLTESRLAKIDPTKLKCIVVDEAHHAAAPSYRRILAQFDSDVKHKDVIPPELPYKIPIIGFSATFSRHDGLALGSVFQTIVYHRDFLEMIKEQWLCNVRFTSVRAKLDLAIVTVNSRTGEFNATSLEHVINTETIRKLVVQTWLEKASNRRSTLVFCVNLRHLRDLTQSFREAGVDARYVFASTPPKERKQLIDSFKAGDFPVLLNVAVLTEGADIPNIDCLVVARPTRSRNVFAQMIGRGMRLSPNTGKEDCHIIDFVDTTSKIPGIVSVPTLFGLDPNAIIDDQSPEELELRAEMEYDAKHVSGIENGEGDELNVKEPDAVMFVDYDNPFELVEDASGILHVSKFSRNSWVSCGSDIYVLECMGKGYVRIEKVDSEEGEPLFEARFVEVVPDWKSSNPFGQLQYRSPIRFLKAKNLDLAIRGSDTYVAEKVLKGYMAWGLLRSAKWRQELASPNQRAYVAKRFSKGLSGGTFNTDTLTKGQAASIITRLKHGAQSRYEKKLKKQSEEAAKKLKITKEKGRLKDTVSVGPLPQPQQTH